MLNGKTFLAIIPARGGSKRLPQKNILELHGKPLIAWTIEAGLKSKYIDNVIVSSDDEVILTISKQYGAQTITRPDLLASDTATTFDTIKHTIENTEEYDYIILLQPTSPLRNENHIDEAIDLLLTKNAEAVISMCSAEHNPLWCNTLPENGSMENFMADDIKNKPSQALTPFFRLNGAIYICSRTRLLEEKSFFLKNNIYAYIMDNESSIDIDNSLDFKIAQCIFKNTYSDSFK